MNAETVAHKIQSRLNKWEENKVNLASIGSNYRDVENKMLTL